MPRTRRLGLQTERGQIVLTLATVLLGIYLGWEAARGGVLLAVLPWLGGAAVLALLAYLHFVLRDWRQLLRDIARLGFRAWQGQAVQILAWGFLLRLCLLGTVGIVAYWIVTSFLP
ncbi:MAG TPA: hypothetical protein VMG58_10595 [Candidatus Sulfotelmatobacter sp.]|nr:hypothetical protein [Candidatus Sulfotelmatobacter sp.]